MCLRWDWHKNETQAVGWWQNCGAANGGCLLQTDNIHFRHHMKQVLECLSEVEGHLAKDLLRGLKLPSKIILSSPNKLFGFESGRRGITHLCYHQLPTRHMQATSCQVPINRGLDN